MRRFPVAGRPVRLFQFAVDEPLVDLTRIDRSIIREPEYASNRMTRWL